jgi:integrase
MAGYHSCPRPPEVSHGHPYLVFDGQEQLHLPLTVFAKDAHTRLAPSSVKKYLTGILPFFTWIDTDPWQQKATHRWADPPEVVRDMIRDYLVSRLKCKLRDRQDGGEWIQTGEESLSTVRILLAGLKLFYRIAKAHGYYSYTNPLIGSFADTVDAARERLEQCADGSTRPRMPERSGVDEPRRTKRLTDCYFILLDTWIPQVVTDVTLPAQIRAGGQILNEQRKAKGKIPNAWGLREECLVSLLFETGARISELMALTLDDWESRGLKDTAWARNKGSRKRRAKFVRFSEQTVKLLKRYFDTERKAVDTGHRSLDDYLNLAAQGTISLASIPLFLSRDGTAWSVASFRTHYWKKACAAAKMDMDLHQCRHWYVNQALVEIHEQARKGTLTVERGTEELIAYMHWRSGEKVLKAYNHFFQPANHAAVQNGIFKKLRSEDRQQARRSKQESEPQAAQLSPETEQERKRAEQVSALYAFLIGKEGYGDDLHATD